MIDIPVTTAMNEQVPVIQSDCSITEAASHLRDPDIPALIVRDSPGEPAGIVTESDIVALVAEEGFSRTVAVCMSTPVVTTLPTTPVGLAADRMRDAGVSLLPVVDEDDEYHGLVTRGTLAPYLSRQRLGITWDGEPLTVDTDSSDAVASSEAGPSDAASPGDTESSDPTLSGETESSDTAIPGETESSDAA